MCTGDMSSSRPACSLDEKSVSSITSARKANSCRDLTYIISGKRSYVSSRIGSVRHQLAEETECGRERQLLCGVYGRMVRATVYCFYVLIGLTHPRLGKPLACRQIHLRHLRLRRVGRALGRRNHSGFAVNRFGAL